MPAYRNIACVALACAALLASVLSSCASRATQHRDVATTVTRGASPPASAPAAASPELHCPGRTAAFIFSIAAGYEGAATPIQAARQFTAQAQVDGFTTPRVWRVAAESRDRATLRANHVALHAIRVLHDTWVVDSGERCTGGH